MPPRDDSSGQAGTGLCFSIGLYLHFGHPELVIFGLDQRVGGTAINGICTLIEQGRSFQDGDILDEIFTNVRVMTINVDPKYYREYFVTALWFYRSIGPGLFRASNCLAR